DQVRDELRRLGYLEHGVDRFVLGGAGAGGVARASARAATRVGLLGGLLFGAALTLAAAGFDARLRREPRGLVGAPAPAPSRPHREPQRRARAGHRRARLRGSVVARARVGGAPPDPGP